MFLMIRRLQNREKTIKRKERERAGNESCPGFLALPSPSIPATNEIFPAAHHCLLRSIVCWIHREFNWLASDDSTPFGHESYEKSCPNILEELAAIRRSCQRRSRRNSIATGRKKWRGEWRSIDEPAQVITNKSNRRERGEGWNDGKRTITSKICSRRYMKWGRNMG